MKKIIFAAFALIIFGAVGLAFSWKNDFNTKDTLIEKKVASSGVKEIFVQSDVAKIDITPSSSDQIEATLKGKLTSKHKPVLDVRKDGDKIIIEQREDGNKFFNISFGFSSQIHLQVFVPKKDWQQLKVANSAGSINIHDVSAKTVDLNTDIGSINLTKMNSDQLTIQGSSGSITANEVKSNKIDITSDIGSVDVKQSDSEMNIESSAGSVYVQQRTLTKPLTIKTDVGSIKVDLDEKPTNAFFEASSDVGSVNIFGQKSATLFGKGDLKIKLTSDSGSIKVREK